MRALRTPLSLMLSLATIAGCCGDDIGCAPILRVRFPIAPTGYVRVDVITGGTILDSRECNPYASCGASGLSFFAVSDNELSATFRIVVGTDSIDVTRELNWETEGGRGISCNPTCRRVSVDLPIP